MRYRKIKLVPFQGNSDRCLILRQLYARSMLGLLGSGKRILNVDETWLNRNDYRRMKWRPRGETNSLGERSIAPRISVLVAMDQFGEVYMALSQANTDHETFLLFVSKLSAKLSQEDKNWKQQTVLLLDGAKYHVDEEVVDYFRKSSLQVVVSAPYSYEAAPIELFFNLLKRTNLNSGRLPTGKK